LKREVFVSLFIVFYTLVGISVLAGSGQLESIDIGDAANNPGSTEFKDGKYILIGSGHDIWDNADGFRFAYTKVSGNFEAKAHQVSIELKNEWAKGGIHARQSLDPGAVNAQVIVTGGGGGGCQITWRSTAGGKSEEFLDVAPGPWKDIDCWLKLTRTGDEFHGYISENGENWTDLKSVKIKMSDPIYVGLAICGLDQIGKVVYDNFTITQNNRVIFPLAVETEGKLSITWGKIKSL
jgi:regulation of enolase protein 1 (concanavalin A-like superfamily)